MVKGKTKSGIKFQINEAITSDARFLYYLTKMQDDKDVAAGSAAFTGMLKLIFGSDDGVIEFMNAVASVNDGICDVDKMMSELTEIFDAIKAKNSSSSRKSSTSARIS